MSRRGAVIEMARPNNPNPYPGYTKSVRCPECGAFADASFGRVGSYRIDCRNCGYDGLKEVD